MNDILIHILIEVYMKSTDSNLPDGAMASDPA